MAAGGGMLEMALAQLVINIRYSLMSISLSQKADSSMTRFWRLILGYGITDEIFAVAVGQNETVGRKYLSGLIITPVLGWTLGTFLGAFLGNILPEIVINALGVAIYAMFLAIILPPARENLKVMVVVIAAVVLSCVMFYVPWLKEHISSGTSIIIAAVISATLGAVFFPIRDEQIE
jgi:predicted branched-subunit amino acid permease